MVTALIWFIVWHMGRKGLTKEQKDSDEGIAIFIWLGIFAFELYLLSLGLKYDYALIKYLEVLK